MGRREVIEITEPLAEAEAHATRTVPLDHGVMENGYVQRLLVEAYLEGARHALPEGFQGRWEAGFLTSPRHAYTTGTFRQINRAINEVKRENAHRERRRQMGYQEFPASEDAQVLVRRVYTGPWMNLDGSPTTQPIR